MGIRALWLGASALAFGVCGVAAAQTSSPAPQDNSAAPTTVTDVVVTAERRTTNLQKTAIAATVVSGVELAKKGVNTVDQLQFIAPAVVINNFGQGIDFNIRGIGKDEHNSQTLTGVITYRDGVPTFPGYFTEEPYYDVSSVEILRGPQGTFAGESAIGGAVFETTNNPIIDGGYHGYVQGQYGNYNDVSGQGAVNLPISDTLAARVALFGDARDSFYSITGPGGAKYTGNPGRIRWGAGRFSLLWKPTSELSVLFKTDYDYLDSGGYPSDPVNSPNDIFHITANGPQMAVDKFVRSSLKIDYVFPDGITLRSISAYQFGNTAYQADLDGTNGDGGALNDVFTDNVDETIYSEEVNLISPDKGPITWVVGGFAQADGYNFLAPYQFNVATPIGFGLPFEYRLQGTNPTTTYAGFGQVSFKLPAGFQLQLGGRYSSDTTANNVSVLQYGSLIPDIQKASFSDFTYKATLGWNLNATNFLYAFAASGFKPGGLNVPVGLGQPAPFTSETVTNYEVGWKAAAFDGHIRTELDGYYNDYKNFQVIVAYPTIPTFGFELNDPNATKIYGVEGEVQAVFGSFSLDAGVGLMHSSLGTFYAIDSRVGAPGTTCLPATGPASATCMNLSGRQQTYAPNFTFNLGAEYDFTLAGGDTLTPRVNYGHISSQWATLFDNTALGDRLADRDILGAQLTWVHQGIVTTLYGTNLTDQHYVGAINTSLRFAGPPRQFGIRVLKLF